VHLEGKDASKFESFRARMANEQKEYLKVLRSKAFADPTRYTSCHQLAAQQIEVSLHQRAHAFDLHRQRINSLPTLHSKLAS